MWKVCLKFSSVQALHEDYGSYLYLGTLIIFRYPWLLYRLSHSTLPNQRINTHAIKACNPRSNAGSKDLLHPSYRRYGL